MQYRREIDGLRAVAVVPVILFHAGVGGFSGGYVGVDVFFVISGYLITSLIVGDLEGGRFSIAEFYARRARRILPALLTVIVACIPFAWLWMPPDRLEAFFRSVASVGLFISNFYFAAQEGYFATAAEEQPLLHTWSLAVEEQYYLLFPVLMWLGWRYARPYVTHGVIVVGLLSFAAAELATRTPASGTFFLPHLRAWELLIGSATALLLRDRRRVDPRLGAGLGVVGLVLITTAVVAFDASTPFPSAYALVPTVGAALVIIGASQANVAGRVLSTRALVGIGLVSYSAYLWHFPLFAFARIRSRDEPSVTLLVALGVVSIALAVVTWRFVEQPFRDKRRLPRRAALVFGGLVSAGLVIVGLVGQQADGFPQRLDRQELAVYEQLQSATEDKRYDDGACRFSAENVTSDLVERFDGCLDRYGPAVLVVGDSHGIDLFNAVAMNADAPFVVGVTQGFCRLHEGNPDCHYDDVRAFLEERPDDVSSVLYTQKGSYFLAGFFSKPFKEDHIASVQAWLQDLPFDGEVVWVGPQMEPRVDVRNLNPMLHKVEAKDAGKELTILRELDDFLWAANQNAGIAYVSKIGLVDYRFERDFLTDEGYTFSDTDHWSALGERVFGARLLQDPTLARLLAAPVRAQD